MYRLRIMAWWGAVAVLGLLNCLSGPRDDRFLGLLVFIAGVVFLAAALAAKAVVEALTPRPPP
jgi:hypothetical protein